MSFDSLLVYSAQVLKRTVTGYDEDDGVEEVTWVAGSSFPCWIEARTLLQDEELQARDTVVAEWRMFCELDVDFDAYDRIQHDDRIFEVEGPPAKAPTPGGSHHIEANLRFIEG